MKWVFRGKCWKFGDNLAIDGEIMPLRFALAREMSPEVLKHHVMEEIDPEFAKKVNPGDIVVAGKRFGQGNPHIQGLLGLKGLGLGLVVESIPRGSYRNAINAALPFLPHCPNVTQLAESGDDLEVDFQTGLFINHTQNIRRQFEPLPKPLLNII